MQPSASGQGMFWDGISSVRDDTVYCCDSVVITSFVGMRG